MYIQEYVWVAEHVGFQSMLGYIQNLFLQICSFIQFIHTVIIFLTEILKNFTQFSHYMRIDIWEITQKKIYIRCSSIKQKNYGIMKLVRLVHSIHMYVAMSFSWELHEKNNSIVQIYLLELV